MVRVLVLVLVKVTICVLTEIYKASAKAKELVTLHPEIKRNEFYITNWLNQFFKHYMPTSGYKAEVERRGTESLMDQRKAKMESIERLTKELAEIDRKLAESE